MNRKRKIIIENNQVSEVCMVKLGGYDQKILIEGKSDKLPVVITLHGGPGTPIPFCVGGRGMFPDFTDKCILVSWDQFGCGINNAELPEDISIDDFVLMTEELIEVIKNKFPNNQLYLFGMSWGSILSAKAAINKAELVSGVIVYGQVLFDLMQSDETITALMNSNAPQKVKNEIQSVMKSKRFDFKASMKLSKYVRKYTYGYNNPNEQKSPIGKMIMGILASPDYKFSDFIAIIKNGYLKNRSLITELSKVDLRDVLSKVEIPYHIIQGETDIVTCTACIKKFVENAGNPNLRCTVIKDAAHLPGMNSMNAILNEISFL